MYKRQDIPLVFVDDGEGGTGDAAAAAETAGKPAGEGGLSHAELAGVGDDGPARQSAGDLLAELLGLLLTCLLYTSTPPVDRRGSFTAIHIKVQSRIGKNTAGT